MIFPFFAAAKKTVSSFFRAPSHPLNLALFRIVLFVILLSFRPQNLIAVSQLPSTLRFAPPGYDAFFRYIPIDPLTAGIMMNCFICFCILGLIGFFTRTAAFCALITGLYVYGVPQFFGKINHYHHLLWFLAILAVSRSGDILSVDWVLWYRKAKTKISILYGLPLRMIWLMIGTAYFFPGYWKLRISGLAWALSDNIKYVLYQKWQELGGFTPVFPIDQYPLFYKTAGLLIIAFELSFIFLLFFPKLRGIAVWGGIAFHAAITAFMGIGFWELRWCYVAFFDWHRIATSIGAYAGFRMPTTSSRTKERIISHSTIPVLLVGFFIIIENIFCGFFYIDSWPFGVYPSFAAMASHTVTSVDVTATVAGKTSSIDPNRFALLFGDASRWSVMQWRIRTADKHTLDQLCRDIAQSVRRTFPDLQTASAIQLIQVVHSVDPHLAKNPPLSQRVLCTVE